MVIDKIKEQYKILATIILFLVIGASTVANAQLQSIRIVSDYSAVIGKRMNVFNASSVGGIVQIKFKLAGNFSIGFSSGYKLYSIAQTDQLWQWNWSFWNDRYYTKIQSDLKADPNLSVEIGSVQKLDAIPVILNIDYNISAAKKLTIVPTIAGGIMFYTKRLYAVESWSKNFPSANYTFSYSYRNFAPKKKGNPLLVSAGLDANYQLFSDVSIIGGFHYTYFIPTNTNFGFSGFPFKNELNFNLGLNFLY